MLHHNSLSFVNEYLAIDSGGYLCKNCLCALIAARQNAAKMVFEHFIL